MTTHSLTYNPQAQKHERKPLDLSWSEYSWPLIFLLSMSMMGLRFPLGYILVPMILISRLKNNPYDFVIMSTLFFGGYGLISEYVLPVNPSDIGFVVSIIGIIIFRKDVLSRRTVYLISIYGICLMAFALLSTESMSVQIRILRNYLQFTYFIIPLMVFSGKTFDINKFWRRLMPYVFILCSFYILDSFIINGHIMLPCTYINGISISTFYSPFLYGFGDFPRIYPRGLFILVLAAFPIARYYKLTPLQWCIILLAFAACRTFTIITGLILVYILSLPDTKKILRYFIYTGIAFTAISAIDSVMPLKSNGESQMRIYSSFMQFYNLSNAEDDLDLAEMGSGRFAQAIPKLELLNSEGRQAIGLGFLHPTLTTNPDYIIDNEYYHDIEQSEEVATGIEIEPIQVYLTIGYIGLIIHLLFLALTYYIIRKLEYSYYYLLVMTGLFWFGLGGFAMLISAHGLILCSAAYAIVLLYNKSKNVSLSQ